LAAAAAGRTLRGIATSDDTEDSMPTQIGPFNLASTFLRLRTDSQVDPLPVTSDFWPRLMSGDIEFRRHDRLVTLLSFERSWLNAEMHPSGDEVVCLISGRATVVLEVEGGEQLIELAEPGAYVVVPKGTWHTARTDRACTMLFITAGEGTVSRPIAPP
jgi:mannose-6-phosphate isomerase-like protein (cupin superfamily)